MIIVNSGEFGARSDGATPISNRRATSDNVPNFSSIDYRSIIGGIISPSSLGVTRKLLSYRSYFCKIEKFRLVSSI
nr:palindromic element RPE2 domain-containing protein [Rickettsia endosymbiont of Oedothorax gibbosus]